MDAPQRVLKAVQMLAAAFPRASWRQESDAAYTMALIESGLSPEQIGRAIGWCIANCEELPTVARIVHAARRLDGEAALKTLRCPACGTDSVIVDNCRVVMCCECEWTAAQMKHLGDGNGS